MLVFDAALAEYPPEEWFWAFCSGRLSSAQSPAHDAPPARAPQRGASARLGEPGGHIVWRGGFGQFLPGSPASNRLV